MKAWITFSWSEEQRRKFTFTALLICLSHLRSDMTPSFLLHGVFTKEAKVCCQPAFHGDSYWGQFVVITRLWRADMGKTQNTLSKKHKAIPPKKSIKMLFSLSVFSSHKSDLFLYSKREGCLRSINKLVINLHPHVIPLPSGATFFSSTLDSLQQ